MSIADLCTIIGYVKHASPESLILFSLRYLLGFVSYHWCFGRVVCGQLGQLRIRMHTITCGTRQGQGGHSVPQAS